MAAAPSLIHECSHKQSSCQVRIHFHNAYELLFVKKGNMRININGRVYDGSPGSVFVIGRFEEHELEARSAEYERWYVILDATHVEQLITERRLLAPLRNRGADFCHRIDVSPFIDRFTVLFRHLLEEYEHPADCAELMQISLITELLILLRRADPASGQAEKAIPGSVLAVQTYIENHFAEPVSITELAGKVFMTACHLSHCFKSATGYSPKQYLVLCRIAYAKDLLASTDLPVSEVALRAGYSDVNNFIRTFRKESGLTPLRYRERQRT